MENRKLHVATLVFGLLFIANAVGAMTDRFDHWDDAKVMIPVALLIVGAGIIGGGIRTLLRRDAA